MIGQTLAHYKILEKIGSGGMGDVYLAQDTKLDRKVALKVLPPDLAEHEERRARFQREAKAIAALDHPNIVQVFSVEESDGTHFITMQLVQGKTLTELLPKNGFALNKFFDVAIPLAEAVAAAHQEGITHRDLKPDNVMVSDDGRVKVLDFGLAKPSAVVTGIESELPTQAKTAAGVIVGTVNYMSPEQTQGEAVDARSDIFSLGIVFYEMLVGQRPFEGGNPVSALSSILKDIPRPVNEVRAHVPRALARVVQRCLAKEPLGRYQTAIDLGHDLEQVQQDIDSADVPTEQRASRPSRTIPVFALALLCVGAGAWVLSNFGQSRSPTVPRLRNALQLSSALGVENHPSWSPDGVRVTYEAGKTYYNGFDYDIMVAQVGSGEPLNLTEDHSGDDRLPSWSPDGREIAFYSDRGADWGLYTVSAIGGNPRNLLSLPGVQGINIRSAPQWSQDGTELAVAVHQEQENIVIVLKLPSLETKRIELPLPPGTVSHEMSWSPDGRRFAYIESRPAGMPEVTRLWSAPAAGGEAVPLTNGRTNVRSPIWSADGSQLFYVSNRGGSMDLWQQTVQEDGNPLGEPLAVTQGLGILSAALTRDGRKIAYARGQTVANVWRAPLLADRPATWSDVEPITSEHAAIEFLNLSSDGRFLALSSDRSGNPDLWILPAAGGEPTQLTTDPTPDWEPEWSPDGTELAFYSYRSGNRDIWVMPSQGGLARQITSHPAADFDPMWSPDGSVIAFASRRTGSTHIWLVGATGDTEPRQLTSGPDTSAFAWSPEGESIVFLQSNRLYRVSRDGGQPELLEHGSRFRQLSPDGKSIYYSVGGGAPEDHGLWRLSLDDGQASRLTKLEGRRGSHGYDFVVGDRYLYFLWRNDVGDIWVMDVVTDED